MTLLTENMLPVMYWGDDEEQRKKRLEKKLSEKKAKRKGEVPPPPVAPPPPPLPDNAEIEGDLLAEQNAEDIRDLKHLMVQQNKMIKELLDKSGEPRYEIIKPSAEEVRKREVDPSLPTLGELDVKVIKTDGFETQGEAGQTKEGESVKDRAAKLRALKQKRGK